VKYWVAIEKKDQRVKGSKGIKGTKGTLPQEMALEEYTALTIFQKKERKKRFSHDHHVDRIHHVGRAYPPR